MGSLSFTFVVYGPVPGWLPFFKLQHDRLAFAFPTTLAFVAGLFALPWLPCEPGNLV